MGIFGKMYKVRACTVNARTRKM